MTRKKTLYLDFVVRNGAKTHDDKLLIDRKDTTPAFLQLSAKFENCYYVKGYLRYKTIFCHKVVLDAKLMNFFI